MSVNAPYRPVTQGAKMFDLVSQAIKADRAYMSSEVLISKETVCISIIKRRKCHPNHRRIIVTFSAL